MLLLSKYSVQAVLYLSFNTNLKLFALKVGSDFPRVIENGIEYRFYSRNSSIREDRKTENLDLMDFTKAKSCSVVQYSDVSVQSVDVCGLFRPHFMFERDEQ